MTLNYPSTFVLFSFFIMRYNPDTERGINIDEIAAQCKAAISKVPQPEYAEQLYADIIQFSQWENDILIPA